MGKKIRDEKEEVASITIVLVQMTAEIVASFVRNNHIEVEQLPEPIRSVHMAMGGIAVSHHDRPSEKPKPAVPVTKSVHEDHIACLEDDTKRKMLRRYLKSNFNLTPEEYRRSWNLPADYPMVAHSYARRRSDFAKQIGFGRGLRKKRRLKLRR